MTQFQQCLARKQCSMDAVLLICGPPGGHGHRNRHWQCSLMRETKGCCGRPQRVRGWVERRGEKNGGTPEFCQGIYVLSGGLPLKSCLCCLPKPCTRTWSHGHRNPGPLLFLSASMASSRRGASQAFCKR